MKSNRIGYEGWMQEQKENIYASSKNEPLERGRDYNYRFPEAVSNNPDFKFGIRQSNEEKDPVKKSIFPRNVPEDLEDDRQHYITTHSAWRPEEQVNRHYKWPEGRINPVTHTFGRPYTPNKDSVARCLDSVSAETNKEGFPKTEIGLKMNEDYRQVAHDDVGRAKHRGQGVPPVPDGFSFGYRPPGDRYSSSEIIRGVYSKEECLPDADLSVNSRLVKDPRKLSAPIAIIKGQTLANGSFVDSRRLGVPSVRHDITAPKRKSVSDNQNYGNEPGARHLIRPQRFAQLGVTDDAFVEKRTKEEIRDLIDCAVNNAPMTSSSEEPGRQSCLSTLLPCEFDEAYALAVKVQHFMDYQQFHKETDENDDRVSLRAFLHSTGHKVDEQISVEMGALTVVLGLPTGEGSEYSQYEKQNYVERQKQIYNHNGNSQALIHQITNYPHLN